MVDARGDLSHQASTLSQPLQTPSSTQPSTDNLPPVLDKDHVSPNTSSKSGSPRIADQACSQARETEHSVPVAELKNRKMLLQRAITQIDISVAYLMAVRSGIPSAVWVPKMRQVYGEVKSRSELLAKVNLALAQASCQATDASDTDKLVGGGVTREVSSTHPPARSVQEQRPAISLSQALQQSRVGVPRQAVLTDGKKVFTLNELIDRRAVLQQSLVQWEDTGRQLVTGRAEMSDDVYHPKMRQAQFEVARRKELMSKLNHAITQISTQTRPEHGFPISPFLLPPPLDKALFEAHYAGYCRQKGLEMILRVELTDTQVIELHQLHVHVMKEGTFAKVNRDNSWHVVAERMGLAPATETENLNRVADSQIWDLELAAGACAKVYKERLEPFDFSYISSIVELAKRKTEGKKQG